MFGYFLSYYKREEIVDTVLYVYSHWKHFIKIKASKRRGRVSWTPSVESRAPPCRWGNKRVILVWHKGSFSNVGLLNRLRPAIQRICYSVTWTSCNTLNIHLLSSWFAKCILLSLMEYYDDSTIIRTNVLFTHANITYTHDAHNIHNT